MQVLLWQNTKIKQNKIEQKYTENNKKDKKNLLSFFCVGKAIKAAVFLNRYATKLSGQYQKKYLMEFYALLYHLNSILCYRNNGFCNQNDTLFVHNDKK